MAAAQVLHFGENCWHRLEVLRSAGYEVNECASLPEMVSWFRAGHLADVVCISECSVCPAEGAIAVTRNFSSAPIVLFRTEQHHYHIQRFWDLEVSPLNDPRGGLRTSQSWWQERARTLRRREPFKRRRGSCRRKQRWPV